MIDTWIPPEIASLGCYLANYKQFIRFPSFLSIVQIESLSHKL